MSKTKTAFFCSNCGHESAKWVGKCPSCNEWNTFVEEVIVKGNEKPVSEWKEFSALSGIKTISLQDVISGEEKRIITNDKELNRVLGGGIVLGSIILIAGEPGIGKSTLFLQATLQMQNIRTLYISGEESEQQIKMRAERLQPNSKSENFFILTETNTKNIFAAIEELEPEMIVIDSIQTLYSPIMDSVAGSIGQVRQCAGELMKFAKGDAESLQILLTV